MATVIRPEISSKNKYWIDKHRYYELKHFCLQYQYWKRLYCEISELLCSTNYRVGGGNTVSDPTSKIAIDKIYYSERIKLVEKIAKETDEDLYEYILKAVTEGLSYTYLKTKLNMPCSKDTYYTRYRRFFWLLSESRN